VMLLIVENCTWLPGDAKLWLELALAGVTLAVMTQLLLLMEPPHPIQNALRKITAKIKPDVFMRTPPGLTRLILYRFDGPPQTLLCYEPRANRESDPFPQKLPYTQPVWLRRGIYFRRQAGLLPAPWSRQ
jgi:hypothetical protein